MDVPLSALLRRSRITIRTLRWSLGWGIRAGKSSLRGQQVQGRQVASRFPASSMQTSRVEFATSRLLLQDSNVQRCCYSRRARGSANPADKPNAMFCILSSRAGCARCPRHCSEMLQLLGCTRDSAGSRRRHHDGEASASAHVRFISTSVPESNE